MTAVTDPFLWAHVLRDHIFDIATGLRPSSLRDQVTRARMLARRAWEQGVFSEDDVVVVSGAGVAGVTVAIEAARYGAKVVLNDKERFPFMLQRRCTTRKVDPNLYDWPAAHWSQLAYPSQPGDHVALKFRASESPRDIARRWAAVLKRAEASELLVDSRFRTKIVQVAEFTPKRTHRVVFDDGREVDAAMVVFAEGPGEERDTLASVNGSVFHGYRFWDSDPFGSQRLDAKRILIAGSGDGALQDFLRLLLKPKVTPRRLLTKLAIPAEYLTRIQACRQHNIAAFIWCAGFYHEHENDLFVHQVHEEIVDSLFSGKVRKKTLRTVQESLRERVPEVVLAHACEHFTHGYPVNRFLVLLLERAIRELKLSTARVEPNTFITAIDCEHPSKIGTHATFVDRRLPERRDCYAAPHKVHFASGKCYDKPPTRTPKDRTSSFDAVILRLGLQEAVSPDFPRDRGEKPLRQVLPTHLAHER